MKLFYSIVAFVLLLTVFSCKKEEKKEILKKTSEKVVPELKITIDSSGISTFYQKYPKLIKFQNEVFAYTRKINQRNCGWTTKVLLSTEIRYSINTKD
jgi:hypothetical protein